ncbi:hypothetical protein GUJ93_ZPchr0008g11757 [Zizania palustris]|uniref:Uncharacterized protein n=1 Tax=Zizania palustris TaxID=103762 RepID=A0A8J5VHI8_ZIZPA|nr:hypothetical protein GUJ93_ZPchr0008g11757 [Zizania palustris]
MSGCSTEGDARARAKTRAALLESTDLSSWLVARITAASSSAFLSAAAAAVDGLSAATRVRCDNSFLPNIPNGVDEDVVKGALMGLQERGCKQPSMRKNEADMDIMFPLYSRGNMEILYVAYYVYEIKLMFLQIDCYYESTNV